MISPKCSADEGLSLAGVAKTLCIMGPPLTLKRLNFLAVVMSPEEFATAVKTYATIADQLQSGRDLIKKLKSKAADHEDRLVSFMASQDISEVCCKGGGRLTRKICSRRQTLSRSAILDCCMQNGKDPLRMQKALDTLKGKRPLVSKQKLVWGK